MKLSKILLLALISAIFLFLLLLINGCKMDVAEPIWEKPFTLPPIPKIINVVPAEASAGVSTIAITGENFADESGTNYVYFDNTTSEVISSTSTRIVVRRPNIETDSAVIKVVSSQSLSAVKYSPYKVEKVMEQYGNFTENIVLTVVAADKNENLYVFEGLNIHKISPDGEKSIFATASRVPFDVKLGPDGNLYLMGSNRAVDKIDLNTGEVSKWLQLPSGKNVRFGDFDDNGNFYTGGSKTDLLVVESNLTVKPAAGYYNGNDILAVRAFNNYVYVVAKKSGSTDTSKVYRHQIDASGNLGVQELVLDMKTTGDLAERTIKGLTFSTDGIMYLATDAENPIITFNPADGKLDFLYKDILHPYCKSFCWGAGNFIYMINGDATAGEEWTVYRVNTGTTGIQ
jgi:hypothetical protein